MIVAKRRFEWRSIDGSNRTLKLSADFGIGADIRQEKHSNYRRANNY